MLLSKVIPIDIDENTNSYEEIADSVTSESIESIVSSHSSVLSCEDRPEDYLEGNSAQIQNEMIGSDTESPEVNQLVVAIDGEPEPTISYSSMIMNSEGKDDTNHDFYDFNESSVTSVNLDQTVSDEKRFHELMQLLDKSKRFSQILSENLSEILVESESQQLMTEIDIEMETKTPKRGHSERPKRSSSRLVLKQTNNSNDLEENHLRRSSRKRKLPQYLFDSQLSHTYDEHKNHLNESVADRQQPRLVSGAVMRDYQLEGLNWLKALYQNQMSGILADEMGLGKTIQSIAIIAHIIETVATDENIGHFLVIAPLSTLHNWIKEFKTFAPLIPTLLLHGNRKQRTQLRKEFNNLVNIYMFDTPRHCYPVIVTSYEVFKKEVYTLKKYDWNYVIIDEGHKIKNFNTQLSKLVRQVKSENRLILTGTPLHNNLSELWSLLNYVSPNIFTDLEIFDEWFAANSSNEHIIQQEREKKIISAMHQILSPFMLRRTKSEVGLDIPPKKEVLIYVPSTLTQQTLYENAIDLVKKGRMKSNYFTVEVDLTEGRKKRKCSKDIDFKSYYLDFDKDDESNCSLLADETAILLPSELMCDENSPQYVSFGRFTKNNIMMQMRKITNHPYLVQWPYNAKNDSLIVDNNIIKTSGKMRALDELLKELYLREHRVILFSQMTKMLDVIEEYCNFRRYSYLRLDGSTHLDKRHQYIDNFNNNSKIFLFLVSTRAGGLGINLIGADTAIIYDSDWNPQMDLQAQDRIHRIGQKRPVMIYRLVTANTIDEKMVKIANAKRKLDKMIIQKGHYHTVNNQFIDDVNNKLSLQELIDVLQSTDFEAIYNYSSEKLVNDRLYSDEEMEKMLDRTVDHNCEQSIIEIGSQISN